MHRSHAILAGLLLLALACSGAYAGDFVPRSASGYAGSIDDPGSHPSRADAASSPMSDGDAVEPVHASPGPVPTQAVAGPTTKHVGADDAVADAHPAAAVASAEGEDKTTAPASNHKSRAALRWQSLLPGVMK